jgi:cell division protein FtsI (penicillin-binding protein 3)
MTSTAAAVRFARAPRPARIRRRLVSVYVLLALMFLAIVVRVGLVQTTQSAAFVNDGESKRLHTTKLPAGRGTIFDRRGVEMAMTVPATTIWADPRLIKGDARETVLAQLVQVLGMDAKEAQQLATRLNSNTEGFVYVRRQVDDDLAEQVRQLDLPGVNFVAESRRYTPAGDLAVSVLGSTDIDGKGTSGLEAQYNDTLTGTAGSIEREFDLKGHSIPNGKDFTTPPLPGNDIFLTLDSRLQYATDRLLEARVMETGAKGGLVIALDSQTGEVLVMSNVVVDPTTKRAIVSTANLALVGTYEPGSVAKIITASAALEEGASDLEQTWDIPRSVISQVDGAPSTGFKVDDRVITDAENHEARQMNLPDIIAHSSNIGTVKLAKAVGDAKINDYFHKFGFGSLSGLGFPNETPGLFPKLENISKARRATMTFGQGIGVTGIQLVGAMNIIANKGAYVAPRLVKSTMDLAGVEHLAPPSETRQVLKPTTAAQMNQVLQGVVCFGTAPEKHAADINGYAVAGKTGTAFKAQNVKGQADGYKDKLGQYHFVSSFAGFAPAESPRVTILVSLDEPQGEFRYGRSGAAPLFAQVGAEALRALKVPPSPPDALCPPSSKK